MYLSIYVSNESDLTAAENLLGLLGPVTAEHEVVAENLWGGRLDGVPAVVLQVMRIKRSGTMPLTVADGNPIVSGRMPTVEELETALREGVDAPAVLVTEAESAVDFPTAARMHVSMFVNDLREAAAFYEVFLGQPPVKARDDYVKFEVTEPPLNLALSQDRKPTAGVGAVNHLGIQVKSSEQILAARDRFQAAGFRVDEEIATACCYAVQTKIWVGDPDGNRWEMFVTTQADAEEGCGPDCPCYAEIAPSRVAGEAGTVMPVSV